MINNKEVSAITKVIKGYSSISKEMINSALAVKGQDEYRIPSLFWITSENL